MAPTTLRTAFLATAIAALAAGCGGGSGDRATTPTTAPGVAPERPTGTVDELVTIDGGRLHLRCVGEGATTVVLVAGWQQGGESWGAIEGPLTEHTRVCSYARFGTGTSDAPPATQTFATQAADLHELLGVAGEPGPYVLVGHSFGGAEAVTFAAAHPGEVAGLVLVDASPTTWPEVACSVPAYAGGCAVMHDPALDTEHLDVFPAFAEVAAIRSLADLPMTVVTAAHRSSEGLTPEELVRLDTAWAEGEARWAELSTRSSVVTIEDTGHDIHVDQPQAVLDEIVALLP
jgi:pimeloyl-ACP methyl ester carboxylesterase